VSPFLKRGQPGPDSRDMAPRANTLLLRAQSDARLVELAQAGCDEAFEAIVDRYRAPLERYARRLLRGDADDVIQQAFVSAWSALERGGEVRELKPWLYTITRNAVLRAVKRDGEPHAELDDSIEGAGSAAAHVELKLHTRDTLAAVAALPEHQREALIGTALEGRSREDVAHSLGLTEGAVRQLLHRARGTLRTAVTAVTPLPLLVRLAGGRRGGITPDRAAEIVAAGAGSGGIAAGAIKLGAIGAASVALIGGPVAVKSAVDGPDPARADMRSSLGADRPSGVTGNVFAPAFGGSLISGIVDVPGGSTHGLDSLADATTGEPLDAPVADERDDSYGDGGAADDGAGDPAGGDSPSEEAPGNDGPAASDDGPNSADGSDGSNDGGWSEEPVADPIDNSSGNYEPPADDPVVDPDFSEGNGKYEPDLGNRYEPGVTEPVDAAPLE
jgi:RNA polymerase sigma factor (sigma-70 family)